MKTLALSAAFVVVIAAPAWAQTPPPMPGMGHGAHTAHPPPPPPPPPRRRAPPRPAAPQPQAAPPAASADEDAHAGHAAAAHAEEMALGEEIVGDEAAPPPPADHPADQFFDPARMQAARAQLRREHGGARLSKAMLNLAEYQARDGEDGYLWEGEAWFGGDLHRLVVKSEGEGGTHAGLESAEAQILYSRAITPYFDLQAGVRHDFEPRPRRTFATVGVEGLAPYFAELEGALFLSDHGDLLARAEAAHDLRLTQRVILQPRAELNLSARDAPEIGLGAGVTDLELGVRLRYELRREFAPYVGVSYERSFGGTADLARAAGDDVARTSFVVGVRAWF